MMTRDMQSFVRDLVFGMHLSEEQVVEGFIVELVNLVQSLVNDGAPMSHVMEVLSDDKGQTLEELFAYKRACLSRDVHLAVTALISRQQRRAEERNRKRWIKEYVEYDEEYGEEVTAEDQEAMVTLDEALADSFAEWRAKWRETVTA